MADYGYALGSALLWAASAPIINHGLKSFPATNRNWWIGVGLLLAMLTGALALTPFATDSEVPLRINLYTVLAGIFTFPLATGMYYMSGLAFSSRIEFASQFSKVKPLLTFVIAVVLLHEIPSAASILSITLISAGTALLLWGSYRNAISKSGVMLGLITALFWSIGEVFMKLGLEDTPPLTANWIAVISGIPLTLGYVIYGLKQNRIGLGDIARMWPFVAHGTLSFGIAYTLFFISIDKIGLASTVLINAFWPILSILISSLVRLYRNQEVAIPGILLLAATILLAGSLVQTFAYF